MAQIVYRGNLSSATFPLTVADAGRSVIVGGPDQNYDRRVDPVGYGNSGAGAPGIPQALYMENVFPSQTGFQSIGFETLGTIPIPVGQGCNQVVEIIAPVSVAGSALAKYIFAFFSNNTYSYILEAGTAWTAPVALPATVGSPGTFQDVSTGVVAGTCYVWIQGTNKLLTFAGTGGFTNVTGTVTGLVIANIVGITSAFGYLIAADSKTIYWSSTTTPTDFTASLVTGAGFENPNDLKSGIATLKPHPTGFFIYGTNVVWASYTGNVKYPWKFRGIANSGAIITPERITTGEDTLTSHYGITSSGQIQEITPSGATNLGADVSNFLQRSSVYDTFDTTTYTFTLNKLLFTIFASRPSFILNRYLFVSYDINAGGGTEKYEYALVMDTLLGRYGKIKLQHSKIFNYGGNMFFVNMNTGVCRRIYFDIYKTGLPAGDAHSGILILGKFQYVRSRFLKIEELAFESAQQSALIAPNFNVRVLPSLDGKNFNAAVTPTLVTSTNALRTYKCHNTALNHAIVVNGAFDLNTVELKFVPDGKR
jgi:hypothetical protein